jgi:Zn-dependent protease with chaperone function
VTSALLLVAFVLSLGLLFGAGAGELLTLAWKRQPLREGTPPWAPDAPRIALAAPALGLLVALLALVPSRPLTWLSGQCACQAWGGLHVCPMHFADAAALLALTLPAALALLLTRLPALLAVVQRSRDLEQLATIEPQAGEVTRLENGGQPMAFVAGLRSPRVFVDRAWWEGLAPRERSVIAAHEQAHIDHGDPRTLALLDATLALFAPRARDSVLADWRLASELRADADAATRDGDPLFVAEVLCRYARAAVPAGAHGLGGRALEARVKALLAGTSPQPVRWSRPSLAAAATLAFAGGHAAHRLLELLLALILSS